MCFRFEKPQLVLELVNDRDGVIVYQWVIKIVPLSQILNDVRKNFGILDPLPLITVTLTLPTIDCFWANSLPLFGADVSFPLYPVSQD